MFYWLSKSDNNCAFCLDLGITELNIEPYDEDAGTGDLRYVQVISSTRIE